MVSDALKPNVQDLQKDVIELLGQIDALMGRASSALGSDSAGKKYGELQQEINDATSNVKDLALRMAIVAPMKAGKSTIINAIVGQDILPSRNAAMTTLPTEIVFYTELSEPILILTPQILAVFQETLLALKRKIDTLEDRGHSKIAQYPHLAQLLEKIQAMGVVSIPAKTVGRSQITQTLTELNDLIRLCSVIEPLADPLQSLLEVPRIYTPFWHSQTTEQSNQLGNLVIIDTPGPNEAGENLRLLNVVYEQLQKSSLVLIVLDFTQLKTEAAQQVKKDVERVIQLRGKENLYVLINKVDQRTEGDMTPEQVRQFVAAEFGIGGSGETNRVFEIAARWAFCATNFLLELQQYPSLDLAQMTTARALAQQALGSRWEAKLNRVSVEDLQDEAEYLWKESGFAPFVEKAINGLMERAAPRCMKSALNIAYSRLMELHDDVQLRGSAIAKDEEKLRLEVGALEADLHRLELCRTQLREVDKIKTHLHNELNRILEVLKDKATVSIETFFSEEEYQRSGVFKKVARGIGNILNTLELRGSYKQTGIIEFSSSDDAEKFATLAITYPKQRAESLLNNVRQQVENIIEQSRQKLITELVSETQPIIEQANQRLNEGFNLNLSLPTPTLKPAEMTFVKPRIKSGFRMVDQGHEIVKKREWWHWLWIVPFEQKVEKSQKKENFYTVSLKEIIKESNSFIEQNIETIKQGMNQYLDEDFQQRIDTFFNNLDHYLSNYRDSLRQAQQDQRLSLDEKGKLMGELESIGSQSMEQIKKTDIYIKRTNELMPGR
ncbi:MAG: dynamin family protein [Symplocastrum torsivum CPER-KK1]|jgi:GTPase Era involved in 16S rRNA processing|uniref:Dynamin family protein n=1 Tax=Symplocastrum torsivum CPER-KK1 TaxID=450513 RepID=A0A951PPX4_9CYAN|nr:dynamin family protein [Symplocastrum torsivum CPER-KK1]